MICVQLLARERKHFSRGDIVLSMDEAFPLFPCIQIERNLLTESGRLPECIVMTGVHPGVMRDEMRRNKVVLFRSTFMPSETVPTRAERNKIASIVFLEQRNDSHTFHLEPVVMAILRSVRSTVSADWHVGRSS